MPLKAFDPNREPDPIKREQLRQIHLLASRFADSDFDADPEVVRLRAQLEEANRAEEATRDAPQASPKQIEAAIAAVLCEIQRAESRIGAAALEDMADTSLHFRTSRGEHRHLADARLRLQLLELAKVQAAKPRFPNDEQAAARELVLRTLRQLENHLKLLKLQRATKEVGK